MCFYDKLVTGCNATKVKSYTVSIKFKKKCLIFFICFQTRKNVIKLITNHIVIKDSEDQTKNKTINFVALDTNKYSSTIIYLVQVKSIRNFQKIITKKKSTQNYLNDMIMVTAGDHPVLWIFKRLTFGAPTINKLSPRPLLNGLEVGW